jgi:hypothetical protein
MVAAVANSHLSIIQSVLPSPNRQCGAQEDTTMTNTNVIEFAPILQRRREQQLDRATHVSRSTPWRSRYRDGIDGLSRRAWKSPGEVFPFVAAGSRPHGAAD